MNSWGDGIVAVFDHAEDAAECGLKLRDLMATQNWSRLGLPNSLAIRVGLHAAPIYTGYDPIRKADGLVGSQINLAARIEPVVTPGHVFATSTFVALLSRQPDSRISSDPLGKRELAKGWGVEDLFNMRWSREPVMAPLEPTLSSSVAFFSRDEIDEEVGTMAQRIENASAEIFVSGNDCKFIESQSHLLRSALDRGRKIRILAVAPFGPGAATLPLIDPRFPDTDTFRKAILSAQAAFAGLQGEFPASFELRFLPFGPSIGIFLSDPDAPGEVFKAEIYISKPLGPKETRPHFVIAKNSRWYELWRRQVDNLWSLGTAAEHYGLKQFETVIAAGTDNVD